LPASNFRLGHNQIQFVSRASFATFPGPLPPLLQSRRANGRLSWSFCCRLASPGDRLSHPIRPRAKHSQSSARWAHPAREVHPQAGPKVRLMRRHQLLLTPPLLLVPQGLEMHTHRCILRSRLLKFVQSLYPPKHGSEPRCGLDVTRRPAGADNRNGSIDSDSCIKLPLSVRDIDTTYRVRPR